jgi:thioredoxin-dependent peroxiredoxin
MSKKTRKKTPKKTLKKSAGKSLKKSVKASPAKTTRAASANRAKPAATKGRATADKSGKSSNKNSVKNSTGNAGKPTATAVAAASHKASSKPLKPPAAATKASAPGKSSPLAEGAKAPAFRLPRDGGGTVSLADYAGKKLVLFFYPRADTPGCTREAIDFTRLASAFAESQTAVLGVSADPPKAQESFRDKHGLAVPLLSDEPHGMLEAYGVWGEKSMYGRVFQGILRTTVLIGADGRILTIWRNVKVDGHADDVLAAVRSG